MLLLMLCLCLPVWGPVLCRGCAATVKVSSDMLYQLLARWHTSQYA